MQKFFEIPKMSFNEQPNMCFDISYICDMHLKLNILNPLNIIFLSNGLKNESFLATLSFKISRLLKFLYNLVFHQVHLMNIKDQGTKFSILQITMCKVIIVEHIQIHTIHFKWDTRIINNIHKKIIYNIFIYIVKDLKPANIKID
jgi:hypothetical protein